MTAIFDLDSTSSVCQTADGPDHLETTVITMSHASCYPTQAPTACVETARQTVARLLPTVFFGDERTDHLIAPLSAACAVLADAKKDAVPS